MDRFTLHKPYEPAGDQPDAISALVKGIEANQTHQTLLGATGTGKTFTIANVIQQVQKPTLVIAHNKTLAAQLASEFREFFPENAVHYFVSYYDYYQPEAYMPITDTYIEKEAMINEEIDRLRHAATQSLLTRSDVIVVASVSAIYGLGNPSEYANVIRDIRVGEHIHRADFVRELAALHFTRTNADLAPGRFRAIGNTVEIIPTHSHEAYRLILEGSTLARIEIVDSVSRALIATVAEIRLFPAKHFVTPEATAAAAVMDIKEELAAQLAIFGKEGKLIEAERLRRRTNHDLALMQEVGYCNGIENYSRHFDRRKKGEPPYTLLSYFAKASPNFLTVIDESHVTIPQLSGMYAGDRARKNTLVEHGFRLPSAKDNRPLTFAEFNERVTQLVYVSATPGVYEMETSGSDACVVHDVSHKKKAKQAVSHAAHTLKAHSDTCHIIEQIIRPTGLIDPEVVVRPIAATKTYDGQVKNFIGEVEAVTKKGARTLVTVLTKRMAEDLAEFLRDKHIKAEYIHSEVKTAERIEILTNFRKGDFDVLVGVNLLREGLDLPEVELVGILDADKEGFLRSDTSLIQTIGRAARNVNGRVILYADHLTGSMERAIEETERRRDKQLAHNKKHNITPRTIKKAIKDISDQFATTHQKAVRELVSIDTQGIKGKRAIGKVIKEKERAMKDAAANLDFETAALLRDEIQVLQGRVKQSS